MALTHKQKYGIVGALCCDVASEYKKRIVRMGVWTEEEQKEIFAFIDEVSPHFKKIDGHVPKKVAEILNISQHTQFRVKPKTF